MHRKKKNINEMNKKENWSQFVLEKRILCQDSNNKTVLIKSDINILKGLSTVKAKKRFVFASRFRKQKLALELWFFGKVGEPASWKMKNASYFSNHDKLIRTLL